MKAPFYDRIVPLVKRPGGKARMLKHLLPIIDQMPHKCYVEPFAGGAAVLCAKAPSSREVINDLDGQLINLYRQVKYHLPAVVAQLSMMTESREMFLSCRDSPGITEVQKAASFAYRNFYSFAGDNESFGVKRLGFSTRTWLITKMVAMHRRLNRVTVEHLTWERCIGLYDSPDALFFCDPPYTVGTVRSYAAWTLEDVLQLSRTLREIKGSWIVTLNDCEANRAAFSGSRFRPISTHANMTSATKPGRRFEEIIITPA